MSHERYCILNINRIEAVEEKCSFINTGGPDAERRYHIGSVGAFQG